MSIPEEYSFTRYLYAKRSVDDRALSGVVWEKMVDSLPVASTENPLRILEVGAGVGTMIQRLLARNVLTHAVYTAIDANAENVACALVDIPKWALQAGFQVEERTLHGFTIKHPNGSVDVQFLTADLFNFVPKMHGNVKWDLVIAHAFLDLVDLTNTLPLLYSCLRKGGYFYFTINFDGLTIFEPVVDPKLDARIVAAYHRTMDERHIKGKQSGHSCTGRRLFSAVGPAGGAILQAGSSDWIVFATPDGYPADEAYFLHFILHTLEQALGDHPDIHRDELTAWIRARQKQIDQGELVFIAHQLDTFGCVA
jgi:SAM-dependent methyltransferase